MSINGRMGVSSKGETGGEADPLSLLLKARLGNCKEQLPDDDDSRRLLPVLWAFLTRREAANGVLKEPASISIRLGLGAWLVTLTDPSLEVTLTASAPVLADIISHLEAAASNPAAAWSPWRKSRGKFERVNKHIASHTTENGDT